MRHKILVIILTAVLIVSIALTFIACDINKICTVYVNCGFGCKEPHEFKIVKGERITIGQMFYETASQHLSYGFGMDYYAFLEDDGITIYDESQPVEQDMTLHLVSGMIYSIARVTVIAKSDRLRALWIQSHPDENPNSIYAYRATTYIHDGLGAHDIKFAKILGIKTTDFQYKVVGDETIYNNIEDVDAIIFNAEKNLESDGIWSTNNVFCSPNGHYHIPDVIIHLY